VQVFWVQKPLSLHEELAGQNAAPGVQVVSQTCSALQPCPTGQSDFVRQPTWQIFTLAQSQSVLGANSQIMCVTVAPPTVATAQSVSVPQALWRWRQVPQPANSPGARHDNAPFGPQSVFE
jgi:hypothetical protein